MTNENLRGEDGAIADLDAVLDLALRHGHDTTAAGGTMVRAGEPDGVEARGGFEPPRRYRLGPRIGEGGIGIVHRATDVDLGREVALKIPKRSHGLEPVAVRRFMEEARIAGQLEHPGILPVYELDVDAGGLPFLAMKLVEGQNLAQFLRDRRDPADRLEEALRIFRRVVEAIAYAHSRGVVHRDLKPANVLVGAFGEALVTDWGLARVHTHEDAQQGPDRPVTTATYRGGAHRTVDGAVLGTPAYMPPEMARGEASVGCPTLDVFGLGAILCEILTGRAPFDADGSGGDRPSRMEDVHGRIRATTTAPAWRQLAVDCLAALPDERPPDAGAVCTRIDAILHDEAVNAQQALADAAELRGRLATARQRRLLTVLVGASLVVALAVGWAWREAVARERARDAREQARLEQRLALAADAAARDDWEAVRAFLSDLPGSHPGVAGLRDRLQRSDEANAFRAALDAVPVTEPAPTGDWRAAWREHSAAEARALEEVFARHGAPLPARDQPLDPATVDRLGQLGLETVAGSALDRVARAWARAGDGAAAASRIDLATVIDREPRRGQLRAALRHGDRDALMRLADAEDVANWPPDDRRLLMNMLRGAGLVARATAIGRDLVRDRPTDFAARLDFGDLLLEQRLADASYLDAAIAEFQAAWTLRPDHPGALHGLALAHELRAGEDFELLTDALRWWQAACARHPDDDHLHHHRERLEFRLAEQARSRRSGVPMAPVPPPEVAREVARIRELLARGDSGAARRTVDAALAEHPGHIELLLQDAFVHRAAGAIERYRGAIRVAIDAAPSDHRAPYDLGTHLLQRGRYAEAIPLLEESIRRKADFAPAWVNLAVCQHGLGRFDAALDASWRATRLDEGLAPAWIQRGSALLRVGSADEAVEAFRRAVACDPDGLTTAALQLGSALLVRGRHADAVEPLRQAARRDPQALRLLVECGDRHMRAMEPEAAAAVLRTTVDLAVERDRAIDAGEPVDGPSTAGVPGLRGDLVTAAYRAGGLYLDYDVEIADRCFRQALLWIEELTAGREDISALPEVRRWAADGVLQTDVREFGPTGLPRETEAAWFSMRDRILEAGGRR